jgi:hypothetical protein
MIAAPIFLLPHFYLYEAHFVTFHRHESVVVVQRVVQHACRDALLFLYSLKAQANDDTHTCTQLHRSDDKQFHVGTMACKYASERSFVSCAVR